MVEEEGSYLYKSGTYNGRWIKDSERDHLLVIERDPSDHEGIDGWLKENGLPNSYDEKHRPIYLIGEEDHHAFVRVSRKNGDLRYEGEETDYQICVDVKSPPAFEGIPPKLEKILGDLGFTRNYGDL